MEMSSRRSRIPEQIYLYDSLDSKLPSSSRKAHIRRLVDILQLSIHRHDWPRANRSWCILARCKEFEWKRMWKTGLLLVGTVNDNVDSSDSERDPQRLEYLRVMMLRSPENRVSILQEIILWLITVNRYRDALDELELYLPSFPYQDSPVLHTYAGLLSLFLVQPMRNDAGDDSYIETDHLPILTSTVPPLRQGLVRECRSHLQRALDLDPHNAVASVFLAKLKTSSSEGSDVGNESEDPSDMDVTKSFSDTRPSKKRR